MQSVRLNSVSCLSGAWRGPVFGILVLAILLGPGLASGLTLLHVHGGDGHHQHVLPRAVSLGEARSLHGWHEAQHSADHHGAHDQVTHRHGVHAAAGQDAATDDGPAPHTPDRDHVAHADDGPGQVPDGSVEELNRSPASRPEAQVWAADGMTALGQELPALLCEGGDPPRLLDRPPGRRAQRHGRRSGALAVLCLSGGLLI